MTWVNYEFSLDLKSIYSTLAPCALCELKLHRQLPLIYVNAVQMSIDAGDVNNKMITSVDLSLEVIFFRPS